MTICGYPGFGGYAGIGGGTELVTVMNRAWEAACPLTSVTVTVNPLVAAAAAGVPEMKPAWPRASPSGSAPAVRVNVNGAAPPRR